MAPSCTAPFSISEPPLGAAIAGGVIARFAAAAGESAIGTAPPRSM
jgi:hypothetical protein